MPVDVGVVVGQPGEPQHQLEVGELDDVQGNVLRVYAMNAESGGNEICDWGCRTAINELHRDRVGVGKGWKVGVEEDRWVEEGSRGARVDQGEERDGLAARQEEVNTEGEMAGGRVGER